MVFLVVEPSFSEQLVVALSYAQSHFLPCDASHLLDAFLGEIVVEALVGAYGVYGVCHGVYVPVVHLEYVGEYLAAS